MAKRYRPVVRDQPFLFPPDMRDWLPPDHAVWLVITAVADHLDTSAFHAGRRTGGAGAAGFDPDMLVTLLVWAYANKVTSSRRIEALCRADVSYMVICAGGVPDHVTIARFRERFPDAVGEFFAQVLVLCARLGMGKLGVVALDGTKIAAPASKSANKTGGTLARLAAGAVAAHAAGDAAEDALLGPGYRGDEVPEDAWQPRSRASRIDAALASLRSEQAAAQAAEEAKAEAFRERQRTGQRTGARPASADVALARENLDRVTAAQQAKIGRRNERDAAARAAGRRLGGKPVVSPASASARVRRAADRLERAIERAAARERAAAEKEASRKGPGPVRNITDPHSRLMPVRGGGFIQGYNAQNVVSADGLIIATELTQDTCDQDWFVPMAARAQAAAVMIQARQPRHRRRPPGPTRPRRRPAGRTRPRRQGRILPRRPGIGLILADAGYLSAANLTAPGPDRLIAVGKHRDVIRAARDGTPRKSPSPAIAAMAARLATPAGIAAYRQRGHIAETPHGNIKHNMGFRQLTMRGKPKAAAEWTFTAAVHNIFKAISSGHLTAAALDNLPGQAT